MMDQFTPRLFGSIDTASLTDSASGAQFLVKGKWEAPLKVCREGGVDMQDEGLVGRKALGLRSAKKA